MDDGSLEDDAEYNPFTAGDNGKEGLSNGPDGDKNIFLDNLPESMTREQFEEMIRPFATDGEIKSLKFFKHKTGRTIGYGFVHFETDEDGRRAIEALNGKQMGERSLKVVRSNPPKHKTSSTNIYIESIPLDWDDAKLSEMFNEYGTITQARVLMDRDTGKSRGVGFVHYKTCEEARAAIDAVNDTLPNGAKKVLQVKFANVVKPRRTPVWRGGYGGGWFRGRGGGYGSGWNGRGRGYGGAWGRGGQGYGGGYGGGYGPWGRRRGGPFSAGRSWGQPQQRGWGQGGQQGGWGKESDDRW